MKRVLSFLARKTRWVSASAGLLVLLSLVPPARADLDSEVKAVVGEKQLSKASVGFQFIRLGAKPADMTEVYAREAATPLIPASNLKIVTTGAALDKLGPDFKFRTTLLLRDHDLALVGDGDPSFGDAELLKKSGWKTTTVFETWAKVLQDQNVTSIKDVLVDDGIFDQEFFHPRWPPRQWDARYEAQVGGMNLNANCVDMVLVGGSASGERASYVLDPPTTYLSIQNTCTTGNGRQPIVGRQFENNQVSLSGGIAPRSRLTAWSTLHDPPLFAATVLAETVGAAGVKVNGSVRRARTIRQQRLKDDAGAGAWKVLAVHETPLSVVLGRANKDSINMYAESLCKRVGYESVKASPPATAAAEGGGAPSGSWANGTAAIGEFLKRLGVPEGEFRLDDGSGLSRQNVISPRALVRVLAYQYYHKNRDVYVASLSVAGVDGTLHDRFADSDLQERVVGKSGYIDGVSTLSGYLRARDGQWYAFSVMFNGFKGSNRDMKLLQERIVKAVDAQVSAPR
jgi:serine-type D-Ala-D-Ala carboxypeptidase/endopeptidase (penicillin-binding protein 4)